MLHIFGKYVSVGVVNTAIHWIVFGLLFHFLDTSQSTSNIVAFCAAVTFSFFVNAKWTFKSKATSGRYFSFVLFMGFIAWLSGYIADSLGAQPLITLISFSAFSLFAGFIYSKYIVFRVEK